MTRSTKISASLVPYVVSWSREHPCWEDALAVDWDSGRPRLGYRTYLPGDRDRTGVLRVRMLGRPGVGEAELASLHPWRQWDCMANLRCQVCRGAADRNEDGFLFIGWPGEDDPPGWPEGALTTQPPVCLKHAQLSRRLCPHAPHFVGLRSRVPRLWGVNGVAYTMTGHGWECRGDVSLPFGHEGLDCVLASHLVRQLKQVKVVPLP